jgi:hypothetical protein
LVRLEFLCLQCHVFERCGWPFIFELDSNRVRAPAAAVRRHYAGLLLGDISMMDVIMIAIGVVFFALSIGYVYACDRL